MEFFETLSTCETTDAAIAEICDRVGAAFPGRSPDFGFLFFSLHHGRDLEDIASRIADCTGVRHLLGCTGESLIGGGKEIEHAPGLSLWLASMPDVEIRTFRVDAEPTDEGFRYDMMPEGVFDDPGENPVVFLLGEPFSMPADHYLRAVNRAHPGIPVVGGLASGGEEPGQNRLLIDGKVQRQGAVGALVSGSVNIRTVVSQGCRPIGRRHVITDCNRNAIMKLGGKPALRAVQDMFDEFDPDEMALFRTAPHIGVVMNERQDVFGPGDFLIRNVIGVDPARGSVITSDSLRRGQTVQFHVRDSSAATADLEAVLDKELSNGGGAPEAALVFSCNGRGTRMFSVPHHDISALHQRTGAIPTSGFFAQGELGPVGDRNHLHGFTASIALFGPCNEPPPPA